MQIDNLLNYPNRESYGMSDAAINRFLRQIGNPNNQPVPQIESQPIITKHQTVSKEEKEEFKELAVRLLSRFVGYYVET